MGLLTVQPVHRPPARRRTATGVCTWWRQCKLDPNLESTRFQRFNLNEDKSCSFNLNPGFYLSLRHYNAVETEAGLRNHDCEVGLASSSTQPALVIAPDTV